MGRTGRTGRTDGRDGKNRTDGRDGTGRTGRRGGTGAQLRLTYLMRAFSTKTNLHIVRGKMIGQYRQLIKILYFVKQ